MSEFSWRGMNIESWRMIRNADIAKMPTAVIDSLCSIGLPIRVYVKNVLKLELCGTLEAFRQNGQLYLRIKKLNVDDERRGRDEKVEKTEEISFDKNISLELPVFER